MSRYIPVAHEFFERPEPKVHTLPPSAAKLGGMGKILALRVQPVVSLAAVRLARSE